MKDFKESGIWLRTLGQDNNKNQDAINKLREAFLSFRDKASLLTGEIHRHLPDYTVHDITHIDSLWEMADIIIGNDYELNPLEAFVLGGAFLLHDAGMSISSFPNGVKDLEKLDLWRDLASQRAKLKGIELEGFNYDELPESIRQYTLSTILRKLHAKTAESLSTQYWKKDKERMFLIESPELRMSLGSVIGKIAHSHWWDISTLEKEFSREIGTLSFCPKEWKIDPLKIACIVRVSDAAHIDSRRAPSFLRAIRDLNSYSEQHWSFQEKLQLPYLKDDVLCYTSGYQFPYDEINSWWLCFDTLGMIDQELRSVDSLLSDKNLPRFCARKVFGAESPERMCCIIPTDGWEPIDATVKIGDVPKIIRSLGGAELYGDDLIVPIRELIQNAKDAVVARQKLENRSEDWGGVTVSFDEDTRIVEITDTGVGMSLNVVKNFLLKFGTSFWSSESAIEEFPSLINKGLDNTGKFGIGFFSILMISDEVEIVTRKYDQSFDSTYCINLNYGISERPNIRKAKIEELIPDAGTKIRFKVSDELYRDGLFYIDSSHEGVDLKKLCLCAAPALPVNLSINDGKNLYSYPCDYWKTCSDYDFLKLLSDSKIKYQYYFNRNDSCDLDESIDENIMNLSDRVRFLKDGDEVIGRAILNISDIFGSHFHGVVTVGGLREEEDDFFLGIMVGNNLNAARDKAYPLVNNEEFKRWLIEQVDLFNKDLSDLFIEDLSIVMTAFDAYNENIIVCELIDRKLSYLDLVNYLKDKTKISLFQCYEKTRYQSMGKVFKFADDIVFSTDGMHIASPIIKKMFDYNLGENFCINKAISEAWDIDFDKIKKLNIGRQFDEIIIGINGEEEVLTHGSYLEKNKIL